MWDTSEGVGVGTETTAGRGRKKNVQMKDLYLGISVRRETDVKREVSE